MKYTSTSAYDLIAKAAHRIPRQQGLKRMRLEQFVGEMIRLYLDVMDIQILSTTIHRDGSVSLYFRGPRDQIIRLAHIFRGRTYTPQGWTGPNELYAEVTV